MPFVVDANIFLAALLKSAVTRELLLNEAIELFAVDHTEDAPYVALALFLKIPPWSNDAVLKQQRVVKVVTTSELIQAFHYTKNRTEAQK